MDLPLAPYVIERIVIVFPALLAGLAGRLFRSGAQGEPFAFAGFHRNMDLPLCSTGTSSPRMRSAPEPAFADAPPRMTKRVDPGILSHSGIIRHVCAADDARESHDHLYCVQADVREGITERLWLLLEMPLDLVTNHASRREAMKHVIQAAMRY